MSPLPGKRACPPEDCGSVPGYYHLLDVMDDPEHVDHEHLTDWLGARFDPKRFDCDSVNRRLAQLCRRSPALLGCTQRQVSIHAAFRRPGGAVGRVTSGGRLVGWLVPATPAEQRADELEARGKLRRGRSGASPAGARLLRRTDTPPLSTTLEQLRREEDR